MNDPENDNGRPAKNARATDIDYLNRTRVDARPYPATTGVAAWTMALLCQIQGARAQLREDEYEVLLDCLGLAIAREAVGLHLSVREPEPA